MIALVGSKVKIYAFHVKLFIINKHYFKFYLQGPYYGLSIKTIQNPFYYYYELKLYIN